MIHRLTHKTAQGFVYLAGIGVRKAKDAAQKRARTEAENLAPIAATAPDKTVAAPFQRQESQAAMRRRANST